MAADVFDDLGEAETAKPLRDPALPPLVLAEGRLYAIEFIRSDVPYCGTPYMARPSLPGHEEPGNYFSAIRGPFPSGKILDLFDRYKDWQSYRKRPRRNSPRQERSRPANNNFWVLVLSDQEAERLDLPHLP
jgi:hypothetical protein